MKYISKSDIGLMRDKNQDYVRVVEKDQNLLALVCDGIGGTNAGEIASEMAVDLLSQSFLVEESFQDIAQVNQWFHQAIWAANQRIYETSINNADYANMGTTMVAVVLFSGQAVGYNIGDSRLYELRNQVLTCLSHDQTYVYEMYLRNEITLEDTFNHPKRNILMNALGVTDSIRYETIDITSEWDYLLLSSDGLHGYVGEKEIETIMNLNDIEEVAEQLVTRSYDIGGYDNVSVILIEGENHD